MKQKFGRLLAATQMSFNDIREEVCEAICSTEGGGFCCYIRDIYPDTVVYESSGQDAVEKCYQRSYSILDGVVTLGDATEVERQVTYVPIKAACQILAASEGDASGNKWNVRVVRFGTDNNANYWDKGTLTAALDKFEGAKVFALSEAQHQAQAHPFGKSVRDLVGILQGASAQSDGIYATLILLPAAAWLKDNLVGCAEQGLANVIGLSVDITGKMGSKNKQKMLTSIKSVTVDVVYDPAAGGEFLKMAAAVQAGHKKEPIMFEQLLAALKKQRPDLHDEIVRAMAAGIMDEAKALERIVAATQSGDSAELDHIQALAGGAMYEMSRAAADEAKKTLDQTQLLACSMTLDRELANSKLPEAAQENIRASYEGKIFETSALQASIKSTKEMLDKLTASGAVSGSGDARVTVDSIDKAGKYLDDFFDGNKGVHSFKAAYQDITGDTRVSGELREATNLRAAITSTTFDQILGDSITRRMVAEYNAAGLDDWKKIVTIVPLSDFRTQRRPRMGGYGNLPAVAQSGAYAALTTPADEEATYAATKRGGTESITLEAIRNDDVGGIRRIPIKLGRSAARTLYVFVFDFLASNAAIYDAAALFVAGHNNLGTTALAKATLQTGRLQMMKQTELGSLEVLGIPPRYLLVPPDLEDSAFELTVSPLAGAYTPTAPDSVKRMTYETISVKTWTDTNNWYLAADPNDIPTIEMGFLDGRQDPELFVQDIPSVGSMFSNDQLTYKIRHIYGGAVVDFRGFQGNVVP